MKADITLNSYGGLYADSLALQARAACVRGVDMRACGH